MQTLLKTIGTKIEYKEEAEQVQAADSEAARKKLRIARMKKMTAVQEVADKGAVLNNPDAYHWEKEQALRQIQEVREMNKRKMFLEGSRN